MRRSKKSLVVFTGGGTAGHVHPGLEVIDQLWKRDRAIRVVWVGSSRGVERRIVAQAFGKRVPFYAIPCGKLRRYLSLRNLLDFFRVSVGVVVAMVLLSRRAPALVFSKGGYVSVPVVVAAGLLRIPVISHESDITVGLATRINAFFSTHICLPHRRALDSLSPNARRKALVSGTPIRQQIREGSADRGWRFVAQCLARNSAATVAGGTPIATDSAGDAPPRLPVLLCVGGSSGAEQINRMINEVGADLIATYDCILIHQTGRQGAVEGEALTRARGRGRYIPLAYISAEMGDLLALATVVVSRAGANALWECATLKKAMVLIPLSRTTSRGDQLVNAELFREHGAALVANDATTLSAAVGTLLQDDRQRRERGGRAHALITPNASATLAELIVATLADAMSTTDTATPIASVVVREHKR